MSLARLVWLLIAAALALAPSVAPAAAAPADSTFALGDVGAPVEPGGWRPADWDVVAHSRDTNTWARPDPMAAEHGADCAPPPATHPVTTYAGTVFVCRHHVMTAIDGEGYAAIYLTPSHLVDISREGVVQYSVSTARASLRDWHDIWVSGFDDNLVLPLYFLPDLQGPPRNAVHIQLLGENTFAGVVFHDFHATDLKPVNTTSYDRFLAPSAVNRAGFELRLSRNHVKFGMPAYNVWWIDQDIDPLPFARGVVQFGHHSYNPTKAPGGKPGTWHWSDFKVAPSVPFSMLRGDVDALNDGTSPAVCFAAPAPDNAHLRFAAVGTIEVSFDGGRTYAPAAPAAQVGPHGEGSPQVGLFASYWTKIPAGTKAVLFRGVDWWGGPWWVRDPSVWALTGPPGAFADPGSCAGSIPVAAGRPRPAIDPSKPAVSHDRDRGLLLMLLGLSHGEQFGLAASLVSLLVGFGLLLGVGLERAAGRRRRRRKGPS